MMPEDPASDPASGLVISTDCTAWKTAILGHEKIGQAAVEAAMAEATIFDGPIEISLLFADDETVRGLNREYRGKDKPTNVLSFPLSEDGEPEIPPGAPLMLGDIILAFETVRTEALDQNKSLQAHTAHLIVHGVLHLLGHDHEDESEAEIMEALERKILRQLGIDDPYRMPEERGVA